MININKHKILKRVLSAVFAVSVASTTVAMDYSNNYLVKVSASTKAGLSKSNPAGDTLNYSSNIVDDYPQIENGTLVLENFEFYSKADGPALIIPQGTTIVLKGDNKIVSENGQGIKFERSSKGVGNIVFIEGEDDGSLTIESSKEAIYVDSLNLTIENADITINSGAGIYTGIADDDDTSYKFDMIDSKFDITTTNTNGIGIEMNRILSTSTWSGSDITVDSAGDGIVINGNGGNGFVDNVTLDDCDVNITTDNTANAGFLLTDVNIFNVENCDEFNISGFENGIRAVGTSLNFEETTGDIQASVNGIFSVENPLDIRSDKGDRLIQFKSGEVLLDAGTAAFKTDLSATQSDEIMFLSQVNPYVGTDYITAATLKSDGDYTYFYDGSSIAKKVKVFENNGSTSSGGTAELYFSIKFDHNYDNDSTSDDFNKRTNSDARLEVHDFPSPTQDGYNFKGWYLGNDGSGTKVSDGYEFKSDTTVYAFWEKVIPAEDAMIHFDANGGSINTATGMLSTTTINTNSDGKISLLPNATREGYTFLGWYDSGVKVSTNTIYGGTTYLVAKWEETAYITFDFDYSGQDNVTKAVNSTGTVMGGFPTVSTRDGYVFKGWFNDSNKEVTDGSAFSQTQTLTAKWETAYTITFDPVLNLLEPPTQLTNADGSLDSLPKLLCPGYGLSGWYTKEDGGTKITTTTTFTDDTTVYARWVADEFTITFKPDYSGSVEFTIATDNYKISTLPTPNSRSGYDFEGWYTKQNGEGTKLEDGYEFEEDMIVYALWEDSDDKYNDNYSGSGFEVETGVVTITLDSQHDQHPDLDTIKTNSYGRITQYPGILVANGLAFDGWYTGKDGSGEKVYEDTKFLNSTTIYANWIEGEVTVTINQDYSGAFEIPYATNNNRLSTLPTPKVRPGYTFDGWYWVSNSSGSTEATLRNMSIGLASIIRAETESVLDSKVSTSTVFTNDATIYASWSAIEGGTLIVSFDSNGGTPGYYIDQTGVDGRLASLPTPTKEGYTFLGWYDGNLEISTSYIFRFDTEVYAKWQLDSEFEEENKNDGYGGSVTYQRDIPTLERLYVDKFQNLVVGDYIIGLGTVSPNRPDLGTFVGWYHGSNLSRPLDYFELQSILVTEDLFTYGIYPKFEKNIVSTGGSSSSGSSGGSSSGGYYGTDVPSTNSILGKLF